MEHKIRIAVAEDMQVLRNEICEQINAVPEFELIGAAADGSGLVEIVKKREIDVVVTDIEKDGYYDGINAAKEISEISPKTAILFLTVHEDDEMIYEAFSVSKKVDYTIKDDNYPDIMQRIKDLYEGKINLNVRISAKLQEGFYKLKRNEESLLFIVNILGDLTNAERHLIRMLLQGYKNADIAKERGVEVATVKSQITTLLRKFNLSRTRQIVKLIKDLNLEYLF